MVAVAGTSRWSAVRRRYGRPARLLVDGGDHEGGAHMRIGIGVGEITGIRGDITSIIAEARRAEADGFASAWFANIFGNDAITVAALCGRETTRIELGTAVVP